MAIRLTTTAAVLTAALTATWGAAQESKDKGGRPGAPKADPSQTTQAFLKQHDKNNDGSLSRDELPGGLRDGFEDMDTNKDGKLSADEMRSYTSRLVFVPVPVEIVSYYVVEAATSSPTREELQNIYEMLRKADTNNDGKLAEDELRAARDHAIQHRVDSVFKRCDKDNDGKITRDECPDGMREMFSRADQDNNGEVTKDDLRACCTRSADRAAQPNAGSRPNSPGKKDR